MATIDFLTHPRRLVDSDLDGERVVGRLHGGDGRRRVGHADPVGDTPSRHGNGGQQLKCKSRQKLINTV